MPQQCPAVYKSPNLVDSGLQKNSEAKPSKKVTTKIHQNFKAISQSLVLDIFPQDFHLKIC